MTLDIKPLPNEPVDPFVQRLKTLNINYDTDVISILRKEYVEVVVQSNNWAGMGQWADKHIGYDNYYWFDRSWFFNNETDAVLFRLSC